MFYYVNHQCPFIIPVTFVNWEGGYHLYNSNNSNKHSTLDYFMARRRELTWLCRAGTDQLYEGAITTRAQMVDT